VRPTDETFPESLSVPEVPIHIARQKALVVQEELSHDQLILAADTIVVVGQKIIGKPVVRDHPIEILQELSGNEHQVITGVVLRKGLQEVAFSDITVVQFHPLGLDQISFYVDKYQPFDKAGAYAIQEWIGVTGIKAIHGDFYNVIGLPVSRVVQVLKSWL